MKQVLKFLALLLVMISVAEITRHFGGDNEQVAAAGLTPVALPLLNQQAEKEMIKKLRHDNSWLSELKSKNGWVNNDIIKIPKQGNAPTVLINNKTYPILKAERDDTHAIISLNKYDTTNTVVTEDELYALPYDKNSDVQQQHREELEDVTARHALHSLAPQANSATTPIITCTGEPDENGRPRLISKNVIALKKSQDKLNVKKNGRILVLTPEHVADLLLEDRQFYQQYHNAKDGVLATSYYGFKIYEANYTPMYDNTGAKVAFEGTTGTKVASICFHTDWAVKATGTVQRFARPSELDPENRENTVGFRLWFIGLAIRDEGVGALIG